MVPMILTVVVVVKVMVWDAVTIDRVVVVVEVGVIAIVLKFAIPLP